MLKPDSFKYPQVKIQSRCITMSQSIFRIILLCGCTQSPMAQWFQNPNNFILQD